MRRRSVQGVAGSGLIGTNAALTQNYLMVAFVIDVLSCQRVSSKVADKPRFNGLVYGPDRLP